MHSIQNVSALSIICMSIAAVLSVFVPIGLIIFMGVKKRMNWKAMLSGAVLFIIFVMILERIMHWFVLGADPTKSVIYRNPLVYALYGAFAAGVFEETARLLGFKFLIRAGRNESRDTGISYGLGHGGVEALLIGGLSAISSIVVAVMLNTGALRGVTAAMKGQQLESFNASLATLAQTQSYVFLLSGIERVVALVLQVSLSLFVLKAVTERKWFYYLLAILLHAAVDFVAVMFQRGYIQSMLLLEGIVLAMTVIIAVAAFKTYKKPEPDIRGASET